MYTKDEFLLPDGEPMTPEEVAAYLNSVPKSNVEAAREYTAQYRVLQPDFFRIPVMEFNPVGMSLDDDYIPQQSYKVKTLPLLGNDINNEISNALHNSMYNNTNEPIGIGLNELYWHNFMHQHNNDYYSYTHQQRLFSKYTFMGITVYYIKSEKPITLIYGEYK